MDKISNSFSEFAYANDEEKSLLELLKLNASLSSDLLQVKSLNSSLNVEVVNLRRDAAQARNDLAALKVVLEKKNKMQQQQDMRITELLAEIEKLKIAVASASAPSPLLPPPPPPPPLPPPPPPPPPSASSVRGEVLVAWLSNSSSLDFLDWRADTFQNKMISCPAKGGFVWDIGSDESVVGIPAVNGLVGAEHDIDWIGRLQKLGVPEIRVGHVQNALRSFFVVVVSERFFAEDKELKMCFLLCPDGCERFVVKGFEKLEHVLGHRFGKAQFKLVTSGFWTKSMLDRVKPIQEVSAATKFKIGVIRWCANQGENEALKNDMSPDYVEFLDFLGERRKVEDLGTFKGGLSESTGSETYATSFNNVEIVFHVPPLLPRGIQSDEQCLERKRFSGNDVVNIIFLDGDAVFDPSCVASQFNHVWVVVKKIPSNGPEDDSDLRYKICVVAKEGFPRPRPFLPCPAVFSVKTMPHFRLFFLHLIVNLERAALQFAPAFVSKSRRTRGTLLAAACESCLPGWQTATAAPADLSTKISSADLEAGKKKLKKVVKKTRQMTGMRLNEKL